MPPHLLSSELDRHPPAVDEIEVTILGPGFGESAVIHIGDGKWVVVDSCISNDSPDPAPLRYLADIGVAPSEVILIVVSHWDDDHCKGMASLVAACANARVAMSKAFVDKDFTAFVATYRSPLTQSARSGVKEIREMLEGLRTSGRATLVQAAPDRRIFRAEAATFSHGKDIEIWTLTPSDEEHDVFLAWAASKMPSVGETRRVAPKRIRNDLSVVLHISIGGDSILLGGDLEEEGNPLTGWSAILASTGRPAQKASLFKVPHHGSATGHHPDIWTRLLHDDPVAIVAPFRNGSVSLPKQTDKARTVSLAPQSYATTNLRAIASPPLPHTVQKTIDECAKRFTTIKPEFGLVRARKLAGAVRWSIELFGSACLLRNI